MHTCSQLESLVLAFFLNEGNPPCLRAVLRLATSLCFIIEYITSSVPESGSLTSRLSELSSAQSNMTFIRNAIEGHLVIIDFAFYVLCFEKCGIVLCYLSECVGCMCGCACACMCGCMCTCMCHACAGACVYACVDACGSLRTTLDLSLGATYFLVLVVVLFLFFEARVSPRPRTHQVGPGRLASNSGTMPQVSTTPVLGYKCASPHPVLST